MANKNLTSEKISPRRIRCLRRILGVKEVLVLLGLWFFVHLGGVNSYAQVIQPKPPLYKPNLNPIIVTGTVPTCTCKTSDLPWIGYNTILNTCGLYECAASGTYGITCLKPDPNSAND